MTAKTLTEAFEVKNKTFSPKDTPERSDPKGGFSIGEKGAFPTNSPFSSYIRRSDV